MRVRVGVGVGVGVGLGVGVTVGLLLWHLAAGPGLACGSQVLPALMGRGGGLPWCAW